MSPIAPEDSVSIFWPRSVEDVFKPTHETHRDAQRDRGDTLVDPEMATVPARTLGFIRHACERSGLDLGILTAGVAGLDPWPRSGRVSWAAMAELLVRLEDALGGPDALERAGHASNTSEMLERLKHVVGAVAGSRLLYRAIVTWFGPRFVEFIRARTTPRSSSSPNWWIRSMQRWPSAHALAAA